MSEIYFIAMPVLKDVVGWNWTATGVIVAGIIAFGGLITTWRKILNDSKYQRSLLSLEQIKSYFSNAESILKDCRNNSVKWHQAIEVLKMTDELKKYLANESHKHIYVMEYMNAAFSILDIIKDIHDFRFFYGIPKYENKSSKELFEEANPASLTKDNFRISPDALLALCVFIDKANRVFFDLTRGNKDRSYIFSSEYFNVPLTDFKTVSSISKSTSTLKIIYDYVSDFKSHQNNRSELNIEIDED